MRAIEQYRLGKKWVKSYILLIYTYKDTKIVNFLYLSKSRHTEIKWTPYKIPAMKWLCGYTKLISLSKCCEATSTTIPSFNSQVGEVFPIFRNLGLLRTVRYNNSELTLIFLNYARL